MIPLGYGENDVAGQFGIKRYGAGGAQLLHLTSYENEEGEASISLVPSISLERM
jgi:hypothetical protein